MEKEISKNIKRLNFIINSEQPEVIACQGVGETINGNSILANLFNHDKTEVDSFGKESRNPTAHIKCFYLKRDRKYAPPFCQYKDICESKFVHGLGKYCRKELE